MNLFGNVVCSFSNKSSSMLDALSNRARGYDYEPVSLQHNHIMLVQTHAPKQPAFSHGWSYQTRQSLFSCLSHLW